MLTISSPIETASCHAGGISDAMRKNMITGAVGGKNEAATDHSEFESLMISTISAKLSHVGAAANGMYICSSCSVSHVAARPANKELYSRYPSTKYTGKSTASVKETCTANSPVIR